jgi:hypothetical protein
MRAAGKRCEHCDRILSRSQFSNDRKWKSCPCCSRRHGHLHVFRGFPAAFRLRNMPAYPHYPQSHCVRCRRKKPGYCSENAEPPTGARLCGQGVEPNSN